MTTESPPAPIGQHGGKRAGAGRRPAVEEASSGAYGMLAKAKAKNEVFKAQLAELDYKTKIGQMLPVEEVSRVWGEQIRIAKERLMSIPARAAPSLLRMTELREIEQYLREAIHAALEELSHGNADRRQP